MPEKGKLQYVGLKKGCNVKIHKLGKKKRRGGGDHLGNSYEFLHYEYNQSN
jgi:hypothetical protein